MAIVIILTPASAKKGHDHDHGGYGQSHGGDHGDDHDDDDGDDDDDSDDDHGGGYSDPPDPGPNGGPSPRARTRGDGGCNPVSSGIDECPARKASRPAVRFKRISPNITQYYNVFGQVVGTSITEMLTGAETAPEPVVVEAPAPIPIPIPIPPPPPPPAAATRLAKESSVVIDMLILQALERDVPRETIPATGAESAPETAAATSHEPALLECIPANEPL